MDDSEKKYIVKRKAKAAIQSIPFYLFRIFPIKRNKIVFTTIEGTTGFTCNPKYIAKELIRREQNGADYALVWLVDDVTKKFPPGIKVVKNTLFNRAYQLTTAKIWIDNSRKQLEVRKRRGTTYIQTWHANLGFKPTGFDRGKSFSEIARLVTQHDSDMIDYVLSDSEWYEKQAPSGFLYHGPMVRFGSPRCDILVDKKSGSNGDYYVSVRRKYGLPADAKILIYIPTFRGGSQGTERKIDKEDHFPDFQRLRTALEKRFGGKWVIFLRLHPQLTARRIASGIHEEGIYDVSLVDDLYEILAGCDAAMSDYSSAAFDAAIGHMPVFLYADDLEEYQEERGKLLWDLRRLPFPLAINDAELEKNILGFNEQKYIREWNEFADKIKLTEDGYASSRTADLIDKLINSDRSSVRS